MLLGVATAATQIEGGEVDSTWVDWAARPGTIADGSSCTRATDHWNRWRQDTELMAGLGVQVYRLGLEWARLEPAPGTWDAEALAHYRAELELLREKGIRPLVTLHHFSQPMWFERGGGWLAPDAVGVFERYVRRVVEALGDLVDEWVTINEPNVYVVGAYVFGTFPPGRRNLVRAMRVYGVLAAAHIRAFMAIHELQPGPQTMVGVAHHLRPFRPANPRNPWHRILTPLMRHLFQGAIVRAMTTGEFRLPLRRPAGVERGRYADFFGLNYYSRTTVMRFGDGTPPGVPVNDLGWEVYAAGLGEMATWAWETYPIPIWITENGTADARDAFRSRYLYEHLRVIAEQRAAGVPIDRYYHWCFVDNWEWDEGEGPRFGLVALDYSTQERTVRKSGRFFAETIEAGGVTSQMYAAYVAGQTYPTSPADG
ncbi:glycoside hydrolase [Intrasporangium oryzae NRRL B-24470]|uniref:Glycoside hydrolase n=1 Tax=Intrasporangium oryzae NRRL B-24470 TaxID=1386089 RepID=W9G0W3_9MICO|nr:family 1 glycosylhydrolase [Intrasporangium oryzae]EWS99725.1 glycoside hydrolase [Intrasporangium oryzae NRRL B-24470]